jgi:membrane dipeptidase
MTDRREFLAALTAAAAAAGLAPTLLRAGEPSWPPCRQALAIDGASGFSLFYRDDDDPAVLTELEQAGASGLAAVIQTVAPSGRFWLDDAAFEATRARLVDWRAKIQAHSQHLLLIEQAADLERERRGERVGVIFTFQGTESLGEDADRITLFRQLGVRVIQLTHNRRNLVGDGALEPGNAGLSNYGHQVVERLNSEKVVVDLAHGSPRTIDEGIRASRAPVLISHAGCRALADLPRNVGDDALRAMADRGGVIGIIFWPYLRVDSQPMAVDVIRHLEHALNVCGEDHVGIGTDIGVAPVDRTPEFERSNREWIRAAKQAGVFAAERPDDLYAFIPDLNVVNRFERLAAMLSARGHSDARIGKVLGGNFARVMRAVWD